MYRRVYILCLMMALLSFSPAKGSVYHSVAVDVKTEGVMLATYGGELFIERMRQGYYDDVVKAYRSAGLASVGIFESKKLDRKALLKGIAGEEFGYYKRILRIVGTMIMPTALNVALMMLEYPAEALFWGSYLMELFDEVKLLCMIFECVVSNGSLSFNALEFLRVSDEFAPLFNLAKLGDVDWQQVWDGLVNFNGFPTKEDLLEDWNGLIAHGSGIASSGWASIMSLWPGSGDGSEVTTSDGTTRRKFDFLQYIDKVWTLYDEYGDALALLGDFGEVKRLLLEKIGGLKPEEALARLLTLDNYNITNYISDYVNQLAGRYYRQRWYIAAVEHSSDMVYMYTPDNRSDNSILNSGEWVLYPSSSSSYTPTAAELQEALHHSEAYTGWSQLRVSQLNRQDPTVQYSINYTLWKAKVKRGTNDYVHAYAYAISVKKSVDSRDVLYEDVYDSQTMDLRSFSAMMEAEVRDLAFEDDSRSYVICQDEKVYYELADKDRLHDSESVSFVVNCHDSAKLAEGGNSWKENGSHRSSSVNEKTKEYCMLTSVASSPDGDLAVLDDGIRDKGGEVASLSSSIQSYTERNNVLYGLIGSGEATEEEISAYRDELNVNLREIERLKGLLSTAQAEYSELVRNRDELYNDYLGEDDDYHRIPYYERECESGLNVTWSGEGYWSGSTYYRQGTMGSSGASVTFAAVAKVTRGESHIKIFGIDIRIHRAIIGFDWSLTANFSSSDVVDVMNLDESMSDKERQEVVNARMQEIQESYPTCGVELDYSYRNEVEDSLEADAFHLLWASDRIALARSVEYRLRDLYSHLLLVQKYLSGRRSIRDMLYAEVTRVVHQSLDRAALGDVHRAWMDAGKSVKVTHGSSSSSSP